MSEDKVISWCYGKICLLDSHPNCLWANIKVQELEDPIMVHVEDRRKIRGGPNGPQIAGAHEGGIPTPKIGDEVVFIPRIENFKMQVTQWGYKDDYDKAVLASSPAQYRCIVSYRHAGARFFEPEVLVWKGTLAEIAKFAEKSAMEYYDMENHDHSLNLLGYTYVVRWEVSPDNGKTWRGCKCPDEYAQHAGSARDM